MLCRAREILSDDAWEMLQDEYNASPIPLIEFSTFRGSPDAVLHAQHVTRLLNDYPQWQISSTALNILNGETWLRHAGHAVWAAFTLGTDCECCLGYRVVLLILLSLSQSAALLYYLKGIP